MEESTTKIIDIRVDNEKAIKGITDYNAKIEELNNRQKELKKMYQDGSISQKDYYSEMAKTKAATTEYKNVVRELEKQLSNNIKTTQQKEGSLKSLRAQLSNTTKAYDELSRAERNGAEGAELQEKINRITAELKGAEEETGRFYRNVGNYENAMKAAFGNNALVQGIGNVKGGIVGVKTAMDATSKTPLLAIVTLLVSIFQKLFSSAGKNEEQMVKLNRVMQPLNVVMDVFTTIIEGAADILLSISSVVVDVVTKFTDWIGVTENMNAKTKEYIELERAKADLIKQTRTANEEAAKTEQSVSELRAKIAQKDKYSVQERKAMLEEVINKEKAVAETKRLLAEENLRILEEEGERTKNSAEFEEKLSQARIAVTKATTDYNNKTRELNGQLAEMNNAEEAAAKAAKEKVVKAAQEKAKAKADAIKDAQEKEREALRNAEDAMIAILSEGLMKQQELINVQYDRQIEDLKRKLATEKNLTEAAKKAINQSILSLEIQKNQELQKVTLEQSKKDADKRAADQVKSLAELKLHWENIINEAALNGQSTLQLELDRRKAELDALQQMEGESDAAFKAQQLAAQQAYVDAKADIVQKEVEIEQAKAMAIGSLAGELSSLLGAIGEGNKGLAKLSQILAIAEVAIAQGVAIANAVRTATKSSATWIDMLAAISVSVGAVTTVMSTATKSIKSAKFATGGVFEGSGYVSGSGTATSDSINARLSNGESVMTAQATSMFAPILSAFNQAGGGVPINVVQSGNQVMGEDMLARAFARGVAALPSPVVSIVEINNANRRVGVLENLGSI